jgi:hypothetical protein
MYQHWGQASFSSYFMIVGHVGRNNLQDVAGHSQNEVIFCVFRSVMSLWEVTLLGLYSLFQGFMSQSEMIFTVFRSVTSQGEVTLKWGQPISNFMGLHCNCPSLRALSADDHSNMFSPWSSSLLSRLSRRARSLMRLWDWRPLCTHEWPVVRQVFTEPYTFDIGHLFTIKSARSRFERFLQNHSRWSNPVTLR